MDYRLVLSARYKNPLGGMRVEATNLASTVPLQEAGVS